MMMLGAVFFILLMGLPIAPIVFMNWPHLLERHPPERRLLLAMLRELAKFPEDWKRQGPYYEAEYTHLNGLRFRHSYGFTLHTGTERIAFAEDSKGGRILKRVVKALKAREHEQEGLRALQEVTAALNKQQAIDAIDRRVNH